MSVLSAQNVNKVYSKSNIRIRVLNNVSLDIQKGEIVGLMGPSGSGKSTLLNILGTLEPEYEGTVLLDGNPVEEYDSIDKLRSDKIGFVFQFHHLLPEFTAKENVAMPLLIRRCAKRTAYEKAEVILSEVGLSERMTHKPGELSGGERQRTAIARALVTNPSCILADEPTGNLDEKSANEVFELILELNRNHNSSLIMVTHNIELSRRADKICELRDGVLIDI